MFSLRKKLLVGIVSMALIAPVLMPAESEARADMRTYTYYTYTVKPGDTLWKIAARGGVDLSELIASNPHLFDPERIFPYQRLYIPAQPSTPSAPQHSAPVDPKPAPSQPSAPGMQVESFEQQVVQLVNEERSKAGLAPLKLDVQLTKVARAKSADMRDNQYFSHQSPTYGSPFEMMDAFSISYRSAGENIAAGQRTPAEVMEAWMNSPGHRQNILSENYTRIGVGLVQGGSYGYYWTQLFAG